MDLLFKHKDKTIRLAADIPESRVTIAPTPAYLPGEWEPIAQDALDHPAGAEALGSFSLEGKKVCVMTDDWGRSTPAYRVLPDIVRRLEAAGAKDDDITFVTASGMHNPMTERDIRRKLGDTVVDRFHCVSHDAGDREALDFVGISRLGTPVWINSAVARADYRIAVGRVFPHVCYGYEGGYKMIVPGVASFETIMRDHSLNFSDDSVYGVVGGNPSRREAEEIGQMVGIDMLLNFVVDRKGRPVKAYAGAPERVFRACVSYGERNVWGFMAGEKADITVIMAGEGADKAIEDNPIYYLGQAFAATKDDGVVIALMDEDIAASRDVIDGVDLEKMSFASLLLMHEKRNWLCDERQVQHNVKLIRSVFYERRVMELHKPDLTIVSDSFSRGKLTRFRAAHCTDAGEALRAAVACRHDPSVLVIPCAREVFPLVRYSFPDESHEGDLC